MVRIYGFDLLFAKYIKQQIKNYTLLRVLLRFLQKLRLEPEAYVHDLGALRQVLRFLPRQGVLIFPDILYTRDKKILYL